MPKNATIRIRMIDDCRKQASMFRSEIEHYGAELWPGELQLLKGVVRDLTKMADRIEANNRLNPATMA